MDKLIRFRKKCGDDKGFTLLEYCAGAVIICTTIWGAMGALGNQLTGFLTDVGTWAEQRGDEIIPPR